MKFILFIFLFIQIATNAAAAGWQEDAAPLHRAQKALTQVIIHDIFSPPVASRIYAYTSMAAYELLVQENKEYRSLSGQLNGFPIVPASSKIINTSLASVYAYLLTGKALVFSEAVLQDSINAILQWYRHKKMDQKQFDASLAYGQVVATAILKYAAGDKYRETRSMRRYNFSKQEGKWIPTPPVYMAAIEPNWNKLRTLVIDSCTQFKPAVAVTFSSDSNSLFYQQAMEVYKTCNAITAEQKSIASFWDCNPFAVSTEGHLNFATKKISPGGHWMSIAGIVAANQQATITKAAAAYTITAIALYEGFIVCWDEKYRSNVIRPETYINKYIDESWRPLLQTPPFPEYPSGHSVVSTAAALVLSQFFGENIAFDDDTEVEFGLPVKHFNSFRSACAEAAISRLYGGIHYRAAIDNGTRQGEDLGKFINKKIRLLQ
ncbi:MAG: vanadium-dependent haloperoxidase [Bacteroidota bacterium]